MPCPSCRAALEPTTGQHGIVWLCRTCRAGAATLPILRRVAPRDFVNQLWQAALQDGVTSSRICPSCTQPFTSFAGSRARIEPNLDVCTRCYWVWLDSVSLKRLSGEGQRPMERAKTLALPSGLDAGEKSAAAKRALLSLAGHVVLEMLP